MYRVDLTSITKKNTQCKKVYCVSGDIIEYDLINIDELDYHGELIISRTRISAFWYESGLGVGDKLLIAFDRWKSGLQSENNKGVKFYKGECME